MDIRKLCCEYHYYDAPGELSNVDQKLVVQAQTACQTAYAPYSQFRVGAAVLLDDGEILTASNQESEVFPVGTCAESALIYYVLANRPTKKIAALAVAADRGVKPCFPCGRCRQVICDAQKRQQLPIRVLAVGHPEVVEISNADHLLPLAFEIG